MSEREIQLARADDTRGIGFANERTKLFSFLSIFHPEMSLEERLLLANEGLRNDNTNKR